MNLPGIFNPIHQKPMCLSDLGDFSFRTNVNVQLYMLTGNKQYLNSLIDLKEQSIYNNIILEFFRRNDITFHNIPDSVIQRENNLLSFTTSGKSSFCLGDIQSPFCQPPYHTHRLRYRQTHLSSRRGNDLPGTRFPLCRQQKPAHEPLEDR